MNASMDPLLRLALLPAWMYPEGSQARLNCDAINAEIIDGFNRFTPADFADPERGLT